MMKFGIASDLRDVLRYAPHTLNFLKEKKEKKESHLTSGGFKKSKFFQENTTRIFTIKLFGSEVFDFRKMLKRNENVGWRFY
jgi:hypothetical protein